MRVGDESGTFNLSKSKSTIDVLYVYTAYVDVATLFRKQLNEVDDN